MKAQSIYKIIAAMLVGAVGAAIVNRDKIRRLFSSLSY